MHKNSHLILFFTCLLAACSPSGQTRPAAPATATTASPALQPARTQAPAATLQLRLQADPSLSGFRTQQSGFALCLGQMQQLQTRLTLPGLLSDTERQALLEQGATVSEADGHSVVVIKRGIDLAALLAGIEITLGHLPFGEVELRNSFLDPAGKELGFLAYRLPLTGKGETSVGLNLKPAPEQPATTFCPRLEVDLTGAEFLGAGGQITSSVPLPMPVSSPSVTPPTLAVADPPAPPSGLQITEQSSNALGLTWSARAGVTAWKVYLDGTRIAVLSPEITTYRFSGLPDQSTHTLGVQASNAQGESSLVSLSTSTSSSFGGGSSGGGSSAAGRTSNPPTISTLSAGSGSVGDQISLSGSGFNTVTSVSFNGTAIPFTITRDSEIVVEIPGGVSDGLFVVSNPDGSATSTSFHVRNRVWYVNAAATGSNTGNNWSNALVDLQTALAKAASGDEIWLAAGTYRPSNRDPGASFQLVSGVGLYGGFGGTELLRSQRDYLLRVSLLSGDLSRNDNYASVSKSDLNDNSSHVVKGANGAILDGVTIQGGYAAGSSGGGLSLGNTAPILSHLRVLNNYADGGGGALEVGNVSLTISDSRFSDNQSFLSSTQGGAILANGSTLNLNKVTFSGNLAADGNSGGIGGAISLANGTLNLSDSSFSSNQATTGGINGWGGAIALVSSSGTISNSSFSSNQTTLDGTSGFGGAVYASNSTLSIVNSSFDQNITAKNGSAGNGGAIYAKNGSLSISGSSFSKNEASTGGSGCHGGAIFADSVNLSLKNDTFSNNKSGAGTSTGGAIHLINSNDLNWSGLSFSANAVSVNGGTGSGGAIYLLNSHRLKLSDSTFNGNSASSTRNGLGGAIYAQADDLSLEQVKFNANHSCNTNNCSGGALYFQGTNLSVNKVVASDNYAAGTLTGNGGAFLLNGNGTTIQNSVFAGNKACNTQTSCNGGAISTSGDNFTLNNTVFVNNQATPGTTGTGGALYFATGPAGANLSHLTFLNNRAPDLGPAIYCPGNLNLSDSIVWDESIAQPVSVTGNLTLNRSIVKGLANLTITGNGNLDSDPLFSAAATPAGADGNWLSSDDGLSLQASSPAIGLATGSLTPSDILGKQRDTNPDAGAYERLTP